MSVEVRLTELRENQEDMAKKLDTLCTIMTGNGDPSRGFVVRFDRMEQWWMSYTRKKTKIALAVATSTLSLIGSLALLVVRLVWGI